MTAPAKPLRSQPTRDRILEAARHVFAAEGFDRATIRNIAAAADINPSMVIRYYGNKDALFAAVAALDLEAPRLIGVSSEKMGQAIVRHVLDRWDNDRGGPALAALLRASMSHDAARERIVAMFDNELARLFATLGLPRRAAPLAATQILGLVTARYILQIPSVTCLPRSVLVREIGATVQRYLDRAAAKKPVSTNL